MPYFEPGQLIAEEYEVVRQLGCGGMSMVYLCRDQLLDKRWAVKLLSDQMLGLEDVRRRFLQEARTMAHMDHPGIMPVVRALQREGLVGMVMPFLGEDTLASLIDNGGPLGQPEALDLFGQLVDAVRFAHRFSPPVVHRDIKPDNVLVVPGTGGGRRTLLMDFGIAKVLRQDGAQTVTGTRMGTVAYMAPEQILDSKDVGFPADVWSLGVLLYEMLAGRRPFEADSDLMLPAAIVSSSLPVEPLASWGGPLRLLLERCLAKESERRYSSAAALMDALEMLRAGLEPSPTRAAPSTLQREADVVPNDTVVVQGPSPQAEAVAAPPARAGATASELLPQAARPAPQPPTAVASAAADTIRRARSMHAAAAGWLRPLTKPAGAGRRWVLTGVVAGLVAVALLSFPAARHLWRRPEAASISISPLVPPLRSPSETAHLRAEVLDVQGRPLDDAPIHWSSSDPTVVAVSDEGTVLACRSGAASIRAVSGAAHDEIQVEVDIDGDLRLAGENRLEREAVLQIWHEGHWGTVCGYGWAPAASNVACGQIFGPNHVGSFRNGSGTPSSVPIWLTMVRCQGHEERLTDCQRYPLSEHHCSHGEEVLLTCRAAPVQGAPL